MRLRRHANRTLFDPEMKRQVTLDEVARAVRGGEQLNVTQAEGDKDVTGLVLLQLLQMEAARGAELPTELLLEGLRSVMATRRPSSVLKQLEEELIASATKVK
ncbi:MAG: hypothetical protein JST54_14100 [Deltaproteobacteria bacterium]|nr:hypothetical protein [Deltaproteobacteria bacterium]